MAEGQSRRERLSGLLDVVQRAKLATDRIRTAAANPDAVRQAADELRKELDMLAEQIEESEGQA